MICSKTNLATYRTCSALLAATMLVLAGTATTCLQAQQSPLDRLTVEYLVGSAVSLSNQEFPEIEKAIQRFRNGDSNGALEFLKKAEEKYPKLPPADVTFAKMHMIFRNAKAAAAARVLLERAVTQNPTDPEAYLLLADQAFIGNRTTEAQAIFELVEPMVSKFDANIKRKQNFTIRVLAGRAAVAERRKLWEEAQQWLQQWVELDPDSAAAHQRLGVTLFRLKKPREAFEQFTKAREIMPKVPHPYVSIGQLFSQEGDVEKARKAFEKAYNEDQTDSATIQAYAEWLLQQNELEQAQSLASALREQSPDSISALLLDGIVAQMQGQNERAEQAMSKILSLDPSHSRATDLLALLLIESDEVADQERALRYAQMNAERFPDNSQVNITKAWVLYRLGRGTESQAALEKLGRGQVPADSAFLISKMMVEQGKKDQAQQALEQVLQQSAGVFIFRSEAEALLEQLKSE